MRHWNRISGSILLVMVPVCHASLRGIYDNNLFLMFMEFYPLKYHSTPFPYVSLVYCTGSSVYRQIVCLISYKKLFLRFQILVQKLPVRKELVGGGMRCLKL